MTGTGPPTERVAIATGCGNGPGVEARVEVGVGKEARAGEGAEAGVRGLLGRGPERGLGGGCGF